MLTIRGISLASFPRLAARSYWVESGRPLDVFFCIADHFEPKWRGASKAIQADRVDRWRRSYPASVARVADSDGRPPQQTFFYPIEQYDPRHVDALGELRELGIADVEVHIHHDDDNEDSLRTALTEFAEKLHSVHGMLRRDGAGRVAYGFIHGDWALGNSHPQQRYCGVDNELTVLRETGCYADFTLPSAPSPTQTRTINSIYYAIDKPHMRKSHDCGVAARVGARGPDNGLLMIQGPLSIDWHNRKWGCVPRLDYGNIQGIRPATFERFRGWCQAGVCVEGRPEWRFVKLHTHGCEEQNTDLLLGDSMKRFHDDLASFASRHQNFRYHYVSAYEMAQLVRQAEHGATMPDLSFASTMEPKAT